MRVLIVEPHKIPYEKEIGNNLKSMQRIVGGLIEPVELEEGLVLICNEEGKCLELEGNRRVGHDIIAGNFLICACNDEGEFCSINDEQISKYTKRFEKDEHYTIEEVEDSIFVEVHSSNLYNDREDEKTNIPIVSVTAVNEIKTDVKRESRDFFTYEDCIKDSKPQEYEGQILILRPDILHEDYRKPEYQLWLATSGFGCSPTSSGRAVYAKCLYDGEEYRWNRSDFTGIIKQECIPDWAKEKLNPHEETEEMEL